MGLLDLLPAERHRTACTRFGAVVDGVQDWSVPTPVPEWRARDIVAHLVEWLPGFLGSCSPVPFPAPTSSPVDDPVGVWHQHAAAVQGLLDDPAVAATPTEVPGGGREPFADVLDRFWTADVVLHTWDLARATGQDDRLHPAWVAATLPGMEAIEPVLRRSGQFGARVPVPDGAPLQDRLLGLIGRDPSWRPPGGPQPG